MTDAGEFYTEWTETYESFDQMNLNESLLRGIYAYGEIHAARLSHIPDGLKTAWC